MTSFDPDSITGINAIDVNGDKIGKIGEVYFDDQSGQPTWITISTGLFGTKQSFAPLSGATRVDEDLRLAVSKDQVKDAPNVDDDEHVGPDEERVLFEHYAEVLGRTGYAVPSATGGDDTGQQAPPVGQAPPSEQRPPAEQAPQQAPVAEGTGGPGQDTSGPNTDEAMTRSEERVNVGTERVETGRARLRKYVVTEQVTQTVPVSHEEVRIEREPITDGNVGDATAGPTISEEEHEVTLHAERPVVEKETVPVERVRLDTETMTDEAQVDESVRKEQIEVDGNDAGNR